MFVLQYVYFMPVHVSRTCAHHQEVKIALHGLWYHHAYRWPSRVQVQKSADIILRYLRKPVFRKRVHGVICRSFLLMFAIPKCLTLI